MVLKTTRNDLRRLTWRPGQLELIEDDEKTLKHLPGGHNQSTHGSGGGGSDDGGKPKAKKNDKGKYIPGSVGKLAGVDTSGWKEEATNAQWAMKKIDKMEELAAADKIDFLKQNLYSTTAKHPDKYKKTVLKARPVE